MRPGDLVKRGLSSALDNALAIQQPAIEAYIARARRNRPTMTPSELITMLERQYVGAVASMGGAAGASAAVPGVTTGPAVAINVAEVGAFLEVSALFCLAVARVHGESVDDIERRRTLVLGILLGNGGSSFVQKAAGRTAPYWGKSITKAMPMSAISTANKVLGTRFITKWGTQQGVLVLGRDLPFGIGAGIGAGGNAIIGRMIVRGVLKAFGPAPDAFDNPEEAVFTP